MHHMHHMHQMWKILFYSTAKKRTKLSALVESTLAVLHSGLEWPMGLPEKGEEHS
jgi:hypothetical protein